MVTLSIPHSIAKVTHAHVWPNFFYYFALLCSLLSTQPPTWGGPSFDCAFFIYCYYNDNIVVAWCFRKPPYEFHELCQWNTHTAAIIFSFCVATAEHKHKYSNICVMFARDSLYNFTTSSLKATIGTPWWARDLQIKKGRGIDFQNAG